MTRSAPRPSSAAASAVMKGNRGRDTRPELLLRSAMHRIGLRFRKDHPVVVEGVRVRPDAVFGRAKVAVFLDGCLWHACATHGTVPRSNTDYWVAKFRRNVERDRRVDEALRGAGWKVVRVWEHEDPDDAASHIASVVRTRTGMRRGPRTASTDQS